jgi:glycosyltransferase involved in cell wall biosynthesis
MELTILMPCLNEALTLRACIENAQAYLRRAGIEGEVLIADNGSTDGSQEIAIANGARVVEVNERGYGAALRAGIESAKGEFVIMGDSDESYDFSKIDAFVEQLRDGSDLVVGNRFQGGIKKGAMPWLHRYIGNPVLSWIGRLLFRTRIGDFHCGLRGFRRDRILGLGLQSSGMEFASEMIMMASMRELSVAEVPTTLSPDGRDRPPHLRTWRDGWRHLRFMLLHAPDWVYLYPAFLFLIFGFFVGFSLNGGAFWMGGTRFDVHTLLYSATSFLVGVQFLGFWMLARAMGEVLGVWGGTGWYQSVAKHLTFETGVVVTLILVCFGVLKSAEAVGYWAAADFHDIDPSLVMRSAIPACASIMLAFEVLTFSFALSFLKCRVGK